MKTKLLRKVRRRYVIEMVITPPNVPCLMREYYTTYNKPFYILIDRCDDWRSIPSLDLTLLQDKLMSWIFSDYGSARKRYRKGERELIWHNNKTNKK
jgi:hypothetical protein